jgi:hypothetical protein
MLTPSRVAVNGVGCPGPIAGPVDIASVRCYQRVDPSRDPKETKLKVLRALWSFLFRTFMFALPALIRASPRLVVLIFGAYAGLWGATTGEPFTGIMFRHPYLFYVPVIVITAGVAIVVTKWGKVGRRWVVDLEIALAVIFGIVTGHIFW